MSTENVRVVREIYADWVAGRFGDSDWADPELEFEIDASVGFGVGVWHGVPAMRSEWRSLLQGWQDFRAGEPEEVHDLGERVVVLNRLHGRGSHSGLEMEALRGAEFTFREGKVVRLFLASAEVIRDLI